MPRGNWRERIALVGASIVGVAGIFLYWWMFYDMGASSARHEERAKIERGHYAADTPERVEKECSGLQGAAQLECVANIVDTQRENRRNESDLAAQWKAADWVMWASILAGAQLISTLIGLYYVKRTLDATMLAVEDTSEATEAMREANRIASAATENQLRAWLSVTLTGKARMDIMNGLPRVKLSFSVRNKGGSPAIDICWLPLLTIGHEPDIAADIAYSALRKEILIYEKNIFQGEEELFDTQINYVGDPANIEVGFVTIMVFYKTVFSDALRTTSVFFQMRDVNMQGESIDFSEPLSQSQLILLPWAKRAGIVE